MMGAKEVAKRLIVGSRFDPLARRVQRTVRDLQGTSPIEQTSRRYDRLTFRIMDLVLRRDSNCVDAGSLVGDILWEMRVRAPLGVHYAFEPLPEFAQKIRDRFPSRRFPNIRIVDAALADEAERASFQHVVTHPAYSGLRPRRYDYPDERIETITVNTVRLDDVLPIDLPVRFVKIDVEGGELGVLQGGMRTLSTHRPFVVFEHGDAAEGYGTRPEDVFDLLVTGCGLRVSTLDGWLAGGPSFSEDEFATCVRSGIDYYFVAHPPDR